MNKSVSILEQFLETEYLHNEEMGSPDMSSAIRDVLTDLLHLGDEHGLTIRERLEDAQTVYEVEADSMVDAKTGCQG